MFAVLPTIITFFVFLLAFPSAALAEEPVDLGTVVVEEEAPSETVPALDRTSAASVIIPKDTPDPTATVPSLIEQTAGVHVKRYGGLDDFSAVSLRGSSSSQVQIYLDDIPLVTTQGELTDLSIVPLSMIDRVEVYRGGSPGIIPDSSIGGVILIKSRKKPKKTETTFNGMGASFSTIKASASRIQPAGKFSYAAAYERYQSDGNFTYINNNGTTFNTTDDTKETRQNNDFAQNSLFAKFMLDSIGGFDFSLINLFFNKDQGIPGLGNFQSLDARLTQWRNLLSLAGNKSFKNFVAHMDMFFDYLQSEFKDPQGNIGLGIQNNDDRTYRFGTNFNLSYELGSHQIFRGFVCQRSEYYAPVNYAASPSHGAHSNRQTINAGLEDEILVFRDRLSLVPSIRISNLFNHLSGDDPSVAAANTATNKTNYHQLSAKFGLKYRIVDEFYFKGNFYRGFRDPTFSELFGDRGTIVGNPALKAEEAINMDAGLAYHHKTRNQKFGIDMETGYFRNSVDDLIQFLQTSQHAIKAENIDSALVQGMEFNAKTNLMDRFSAYASYTLQYAKNDGSSPVTNGKYIPGRPKNELATGLVWNENWLHWFGTRLFGDLHYMSGNYLDTQNLLSVNNRTLISAGAAVIILKGFNLSFTVKNILNELTSDLVGYPLPGRSYWASANLKI